MPNVRTGAPRLFCFGLGYSARRLAMRLLARGWRVAGTVRETDKAARLRAAGIEVFAFDSARPLDDPAGALADAAHLLVSVPPERADGGTDAVLDQHHADLLARAGHLRWIGYLSTTGVYGNRDGAWVDEAAALDPSSARSRRRVAAESAWRALHVEHGLPVHIFRLAGIYGPGRSPFDALRKGSARRIDRPEQKFGRIHVDDIARVLEASIDRPDPGRVYNVADDEPAAPAEVTAYAAELLGVTPPPLVSFEDAEMSEMARTFWRDNKRVDNTRLHRELGVELRYPSYREGLRAVLAAERDEAAGPSRSG